MGDFLAKIIAELRLFFAYMAGFVSGRKVQRLEDEKAALEERAAKDAKINDAVQEVNLEFEKMRVDYLNSLTHPDQLPGQNTSRSDETKSPL
ncbi:hypothetical protein [Caudoviricetes sp.]|nr:hypothetical protein [Caudoviricetes sp.]